MKCAPPGLSVCENTSSNQWPVSCMITVSDQPSVSAPWVGDDSRIVCAV
jgi:hypothetical protein